MASIFKDKKTGKWGYRISYTDNNGNRHQPSKVTFKTKKEAEIAASEREIQIFNQENYLINNDITFAKYFSYWCHTYKMNNISRSTESKYLSEIKRVETYFKDTKLTEITRKMYQDYINKRGKGTSKDTVEKTHNKLKGCIKMALAENLIDVDPSFGIILKYDVPEKRGVKSWIEHESKLLFDVFKRDVTAPNVILYIALSTGLRIGEIYGLKWEDIEGDKLSVRRGYDYHYTQFTPGKTYASILTIAISKQCQTVINKYKLLVKSIHKEYLFLGKFNRPILSYNTVLK